MNIHIPVTPLAKPRMTRSDKWKQRKVVMDYRAYGDALRLLLPHYELPERVRVTFYLPMPASWSLKKRVAMNGKPHQQRPDIDNLVKGLLDHLAEEDSYIWHVDAQKIWAENGSIALEEVI